MAPHSSTLAWKIPWMEEPGRLQSMRSLRVGNDWATSLSLFTFIHWRRKWQPTPVFLPGESQGRGSLGGLPSMESHRVGHDWSDLAAAAYLQGVKGWMEMIRWSHDIPEYSSVFLEVNPPPPNTHQHHLGEFITIQVGGLQANNPELLALWKVILSLKHSLQFLCINQDTNLLIYTKK